MAAAVGMIAGLSIGASSPTSTRLDFQSCGLAMNEEYIDGNGLRGTLEHNIERVRAGLQRIAGPIVFQPNKAEIQALLPWILGTAVATTTYALSDVVILRVVEVDYRGGSAGTSQVFTYTDCGVDSATFSASQGQPLTVSVNAVGRTESQGNTPTSLSIDTATGPWIFSDCVLSINSVTTKFREFSLEINNNVDKDRFFNSLTLTTIQKLDRMSTLTVSAPFGDHTALYGTGAGGVAWSATFTNPGSSDALVFSGPKVALPRKGPTIQGRSEIMLPLSGICYKSGSTASVTATCTA